MDIKDYGGVVVCGNFAEVLPDKPESLDYESSAKWVEPYELEWREVMGDAICSCTTVEVHYAPYYGFDYYHSETCSLMRKLKSQPQIENLREVYLPRMHQWSDSVENDGKIHIWVENKSRRKTVEVKRKSPVMPQSNLILFA